MIMTRKSKKETLTAKEIQHMKRRKPLPENKYIPAQISECEFKPTTKGEMYLSAKWNHLTEGTAFHAHVFNNTSSSGLEALYDAILPENLNEFSETDLMDAPVLVKLKFSNGDGDKQYTNISAIKSFDEGHHALYESFLNKRQEAEALEEELTEINEEDGTVMRRTTMKGLCEDDHVPSRLKSEAKKSKTSDEKNSVISKDKDELAKEAADFDEEDDLWLEEDDDLDDDLLLDDEELEDEEEDDEDF